MDKWALLLAATVALLSVGCERGDYSGASFPPVQGAKKDSVFHLVVFRPEGKGVPWGDAALYHRESPAELGAVPVPFRASLDGLPMGSADAEGVWARKVSAASHGLRASLPGREVLQSFRVEPDQLRVELWSIEREQRILGAAGTYPRSALTAWPVEDLARQLRAFRVLRTALEQALAEGELGRLERLMTEDFHDPLGERKSFLRAAIHGARQGKPWRIVGDGWLAIEGSQRRAHLTLERGDGRIFPTLELVEDPKGPSGLRIRGWY